VLAGAVWRCTKILYMKKWCPASVHPSFAPSGLQAMLRCDTDQNMTVEPVDTASTYWILVAQFVSLEI